MLPFVTRLYKLYRMYLTCAVHLTLVNANPILSDVSICVSDVSSRLLPERRLYSLRRSPVFARPFAQRIAAEWFGVWTAGAASSGTDREKTI